MKRNMNPPHISYNFIDLLQKLFSIFNFGFRRLLLKENQKQLETLQKEIPTIIETILTDNKKHVKKLIHKHINFNSKIFNSIHNQIMTKLIEQAQEKNITFIFIPKISISPNTNKFYFRLQLILLSFTLNYIHSIKNNNYTLLRRILEADVFNSFPNFQQSLLIRKYMEALMLNNLEQKMHTKTENFRQFLFQEGKILDQDSQKPLDENNFVMFIRSIKSLIKVINNLSKLFKLVDEYHICIPLKFRKKHNYFKRNVSNIFKWTNNLFNQTRRTFSIYNPTIATQHFFFFQFNIPKLKSSRIGFNERLHTIFQRYVTGRILFSEQVNFWITIILDLPSSYDNCFLLKTHDKFEPFDFMCRSSQSTNVVEQFHSFEFLEKQICNRT
jgi:hypothetical protein